MSAKRKLPDEDFVLKSGDSTEVTKTVSVTIHDFIKRIDDLENKKKPIEGPDFCVGGKKFRIVIYPEDEDEDDQIGVYLWNLNEEKIKVSYTFKNEPMGEMDNQDQEIDPYGGDGTCEFLSHEKYKKWAEDNGDVFKVEAEITLRVLVDNPEPMWETFKRKRVAAPQSDLQAEISTLFTNNNNDRLFTDFTILSQDGKKFPCHRVILAAQSPVMLAMMSTDMREKQENEANVKHSDEVVGHFVEYFYSRKVPQEALQANLASFFDLACFYDLAPLKLLTEEAAIQMMAVENMVELYVLADLNTAANLKRETETFIRRNKKKLKDMDLTGYPPHVIQEIFRLLI